MAPLIHALKAETDQFEISICVTAQHRQMLDQVLNTFEIVPDVDLDLMYPGQDLFEITAKILQRMKIVISDYKPDILLVHGDTTTAMAAALSAFYAGIPLGHVEAGLRTYDILAPFPEEFNRQLVGKIAKWHFAPTDLSRLNLLSEGVCDKNITVTGNTVIDALMWILARIEKDPLHAETIVAKLNKMLPFAWKKGRYILITGHRRENFGNSFQKICEALKELAYKYKDVHFVYPVHLNPNVLVPVNSNLSNLENFHLIDPLEYEPFLILLKYCYAVLTDSGGIQEEAPSLKKPVLVMRDVTERTEAISAGTVELVGADKERIVSGISRLLDDKDYYLKMSRAHNPYGDGFACKRIIKCLREI